MDIQELYLIPNQFSRPGRPLISVKGIVTHWVGNPKTTAIQNRNYFDNLRFQNPTPPKTAVTPAEIKAYADSLKYASAHFVIGLEGEVVQCLLENEMGHHVGAVKYTERALKELSNYPNNCTLGIELCHTNWEGEFTGDTLRAAKVLILELCERYNLGRDNIYRHFDITGKDCPRYFVQNEKQWTQFLNFTFGG